MHHLHDVVDGKAGVLYVGHLVTVAVFHLLVGDETILFYEVEELSAGKGMSDGDLNGLAIEFLGELDGVADGSLGFARKAEDEITMYDEAKGLAVLDKGAGALNCRTLLDVLEYLGVPGFKTDDEQPTSGFLHRFERLIVGGDA